tara:strand:+ start:915 stop:2225 length:1311 start_codon:yes stop_codon:yes gene_type:complete
VSNQTFKTTIFENDVLCFESHINEFTDDIYSRFDSIAKKIGLDKNLDDLFQGKKVNHTEDLGAKHPIQRELNVRMFDEENQDNSNTYLFSKYHKEAKNIVIIGIGGSFEGPKLLIESIGNTYKNYIFISGSDPEEFKEKTKKLKPDQTIFLISSKSFTTDETITTLKTAISWSGDTTRFIAITADKAEVKKYNIDKVIEFNKEIGGRYSIWSDISLPAQWEDKNLQEMFNRGGRQADIDIKNDKGYFKFVKTLAYSDIWLHNFKNKSSRAVLSYIWKLRSFPNYIQQLEMESLGKQPSKKYSEFKKTGQIIFGGYGPTAQHSYFQLLHQGTQEICADIIASKEDQDSLAYAQAITQAKILSNGADDLLEKKEKINGNVPANLFLINKVDSYSLGYLIATWEHRTFITSTLLGINPFDQFGVSAGKIYTKKYLSEKA